MGFSRQEYWSGWPLPSPVDHILLMGFSRQEYWSGWPFPSPVDHILLMGFSRQEYWSGWPFPSPVDHILSDLSTMTRPSWMAPHGMAECHWVRQDCGPVIRLACCLWLWFQSVCPLTPSLSAYRLTWFLLPWTQGLSSRLLQKSAAAPPYLGCGVAPPAAPLCRCSQCVRVGL